MKGQDVADPQVRVPVIHDRPARDEERAGAAHGVGETGVGRQHGLDQP